MNKENDSVRRKIRNPFGMLVAHMELDSGAAAGTIKVSVAILADCAKLSGERKIKNMRIRIPTPASFRGNPGDFVFVIIVSSFLFG